MQEEGYQRYQQPRHREYLALTQKSYRVTVSLGLLVWALTLFGLVFIFEIPTFLKRDDFSGIAQTAANLSAICLTLFTLVHMLSSKDHYLKLILATLSLEFVSATFLSMLVLATTDITVIEPFRQTVTMTLLIVIVAAIGFVGVVSANIDWFSSASNPTKFGFPLKIRISRPKIKITGHVIDYSTFVLPFATVILWAQPLEPCLYYTDFDDRWSC